MAPKPLPPEASHVPDLGEDRDDHATRSKGVTVAGMCFFVFEMGGI